MLEQEVCHTNFDCVGECVMGKRLKFKLAFFAVAAVAALALSGCAEADKYFCSDPILFGDMHTKQGDK